MSNKSTSWGKVANWYDKHLEEGEDTYQEKLIKPNLLRLLEVNKGQTILDVGCGQGFFAREIGKLGAKVVGVDVGGELIKIAKEKSGTNETYLVMSADKMTGLQTERFDSAICILALQNIKNLSQSIVEIARVLKKGGKCLLVLNHPNYRIPNSSSWGFDEEKNTQYRRIDSYMSEVSQEVDMTQGIADISKKKFTMSFHHPLQVYFKAFFKSGLLVSRLEEWVSHKISDKGPRKLAEDKARKEIPLFMCLELIKK